MPAYTYPCASQKLMQDSLVMLVVLVYEAEERVLPVPLSSLLHGAEISYHS